MASVLVERNKMAGTLGQQFGGERDVYAQLGYRTVLGFSDYAQLHKRDGIAKRVINLPPQDTWKRPPLVTDEGGSESAFSVAFANLAKKNRIWHYFMRADRVARIGQYGVVLLGIKGGSLESPVGSKQVSGIDGLLYLKPLSEENAQIQKLNENVSSDRYGLPEFYNVYIHNPEAPVSQKTTAVKAHWSRIIHIAENLDEDDIYGKPALMDIFNNLDDMLKVVGGSSEAIWKLVYKGFVVSAKDGYTLPTDPDEKDDMEDLIDEYVHGLRRWLALNGFDMQELGGQVIDPTGMFKILVSIIAAATDIPQRRLIGSERGELASSQDETNWNSTIAGRRLDFAEPIILRPFIDRMIFAGVLPEPQGEYVVEWPDAFEIDQIERAKLAKNVAQALSYVAPDGQIHMIVNPAEFVRKFFPELLEGLNVVDVDELIAEVEEIAQRKLEMEAEFEQPQQIVYPDGDEGDSTKGGDARGR